MKKSIPIAIFMAVLIGAWQTSCSENQTDATTTTIQTSEFNGVQGNCTNGGVKIEVLYDDIVQKDQTQYLFFEFLA